MDNGLCKFRTRLEVVLLTDPNDIHKNIMLEITSYWELMKSVEVYGYFMIAWNFCQIQCRLNYRIVFQWNKWKMKKSDLYSQSDKMFL